MKLVKLKALLPKDAWVLRQNPDSDELHLFKAQLTADEKIINESSSACCGIGRDPLWRKKDHYVGELDTRFGCAEIGRPVCAHCIAHFYKTPEKKK